MHIIKMKLEDLNPAKYNPRVDLKPGDEQYENIKNSIKQFGYIDPIIVNVKNDSNIIVGGHQRYKVLKDLGYDEIDVVQVDMEEDEEKACNITLNQATGDWDFDKLRELLEELKNTNFKMEDYGFEKLEKELKEKLEKEKEIVEDEAPEPAKEAVSKYGQIYKLGRHRLMCGDSTKKEDINLLLDGANIDMVFTDPPYNVAFNGRSKNFEVIKNDKLSDDDFTDFINKTINIIKYVNPKQYYIWCNWKFYAILQTQLEYKNCIVWAKNIFGLGKGYRHQHEFCLYNGSIDEEINNESDLWQIKKDSNYVHPTQKPVELSHRALNNHKDSKNILDLFGGSGSTLIGCEQNKRNCYMMELDPIYIDVIIKRWEDFTGQKAELLSE